MSKYIKVIGNYLKISLRSYLKKLIFPVVKFSHLVNLPN